RTATIARRLSRDRPFDIVHACNPPDFLLATALPLKARGTRFIFDHHDLVPELYRARLKNRRNLLSHVTRVLAYLRFRWADVVTRPAMIRLASELGLADVDVPGRITDEELTRILSTADVCLAPDPKNPLSDVSTMNKIIEYMAMGRPIVSYDLVESRVSAADAALYAQPNNERSFAGAINQLLDDPARRAEMGAAGRKRVETELSWERS